MFFPRLEEEQLGRLWELYKLDLHVADSMRKDDQLLRADHAADAARLYLRIMHALYGKCNLAAAAGSSFLL